jgi:hypothetical protein
MELGLKTPLAIKPGGDLPDITVRTAMSAASDRVPGPIGSLNVFIGAVEDRPPFFLVLAVSQGQLVGFILVEVEKLINRFNSYRVSSPD